MSIKMNDHDLTDEKKKELEKLSENLIPFEHELVDQTESLEEKISDLESTIEDLEADIENEKERADIAVDEVDQVRKESDSLWDYISYLKGILEMRDLEYMEFEEHKKESEDET